MGITGVTNFSFDIRKKEIRKKITGVFDNYFFKEKKGLEKFVKN